MAQLILLRHGESMWNKKNLFTGWVDVPLSYVGIEEAQRAGVTMKDLSIDVIFSSQLIRAIMTAMITFTQREDMKVPIIQHNEHASLLGKWGELSKDAQIHDIIPVYLSEELNERMYGNLQGMNKQQAKECYGEETVQIWRRSLSVAPPQGESLEMTIKRVLPYFYAMIVPWLVQDKNVLIVAHNNSLRAIIKEIENISDQDIQLCELQTGIPLRYQYKDQEFKKIS